MPMLYQAYDVQRSMLAGASALANVGAQFFGKGFMGRPMPAYWGGPLTKTPYFNAGPLLAHALDVFAHAAAPWGKPAFGLDRTVVDGKTVPVVEHIVLRKPFGQLKHFVRQGVPKGQPKLLIVAPMSGHYATLLRGTVERLLPGHEVYITDWRDAKLVPMKDGHFNLDDYIDYLIAFLQHIAAEDGVPAHMLAVCQPSVPSLAAAALMAADQDPARPLTLTMMGGPIDTREAPTAVNTMAQKRPIDWFRHNVIAKVPPYYAGAGRPVYPGFLQLAGFMSMNLGNHLVSHWDMFKHLVVGDGESADASKAFYEEYRAVCDMTAEFYLQTVELVFQRHALPKGEMRHRGRRVDVGAIRDIALLAIEGERDDISGIGQTKAALTIATGLSDAMKHYHLAKEVGHYGIFNGSKWRDRIAPVLEDWIVQHEPQRKAVKGGVTVAPVAPKKRVAKSANKAPRKRKAA